MCGIGCSAAWAERRQVSIRVTIRKVFAKITPATRQQVTKELSQPTSEEARAFRKDR